MSGRKKIFFVIPTLTQGGAERVFVTLINHLDRKLFSVSLIVINMRDEMYLEEIRDDVRIVDLNRKHVRTALPNLIFCLWKFKPDIVISTMGYLNLAIGIFRFAMPKNIVFFARETIVVSERLQRIKIPRLWSFWYRRYYPRFKRVICQSRDMLNDLSRLIGSPQNLVLINNAVDVRSIRKLSLATNSEVDDFFYDKDRICLAAAGRLIEQKGFEILIEAISKVADRRLKLAILGDGPLKNKLSDLIVKLGIERNVFLVGHQDNPYPWIARADAFVLSSLYEGFPNVLLESLVCKTPLISTPAPGGTKEIIERVPGCILATAVSSSALAEAIARFINTKPLEIHENAFEPYKVENIVQKYQDTFMELNAR